jgi:hypothetical protein
MSYLDSFDPSFWLTIGTMTFAFWGVALKYILKSKCDKCSCCCGLLKVHRNTEVERDIELSAVEPEGNASAVLPAPAMPAPVTEALNLV